MIVNFNPYKYFIFEISSISTIKPLLNRSGSGPLILEMYDEFEADLGSFP